MYKTRYYVYIAITVLVAFIWVMDRIVLSVLSDDYYSYYGVVPGFIFNLACLVFLVSVIGLLGKIHRDITGEQ